MTYLPLTLCDNEFVSIYESLDLERALSAYSDGINRFTGILAVWLFNC